MNIRRLIPAAALAGAAALGLTTLTACSSADAGDGRTAASSTWWRRSTRCSSSPSASAATTSHVTTLTKPGVEPHDLEITPRQTAQLSEAELVVYLKGLQPAVDRAIGAGRARARRRRRLVHHPGGPRHGGGTATATAARHGHEDERRPRATRATPPPIRTSGSTRCSYAQVAEGVGKALEKADPDHAAAYKKNTAALVEQLGALDNDFKNGLKDRGTDTFITTHAAFGYLAERYGLHQEAISGLDPESEPSPARMRELHDDREEGQVTTVFFETLVSDKTAKTLAGDSGPEDRRPRPHRGDQGQVQGR